VTCPLCGERKARRACPALGKQICAVCCGTKRLVEIACPSHCPYLASAREHPPAAVVRRQQDDLGAIVGFMDDLNERQSRLFFLLLTFIATHPGTRTGAAARNDFETLTLDTLVDKDVADALGAVAATYETAVRGVIYEHRAPSPHAERLTHELTPLLAEAGRHSGPGFPRDAAVVLRRVESAAREAMSRTESGRRAFLDLVGRIMQRQLQEHESSGADKAGEPPRIIMP
jgi:hypothetical protein